MLSGPQLDPPGPNERLDGILGATIHQATSDEPRRAGGPRRRGLADLRAAGRRPYVIGVGGTGPIGAAGQVLAGLELAGQARDAGIESPTIVVPSATGGTHAGLLVGLAIAAMPSSCLGVAVAAPADQLRPTIVRLLAEPARR